MTDLKDYLRIMREQLHKIPEIGFDLFKTHALVKEELTALGYEVEVVAKTGLVAKKQGERDDAIAFRADMDALPLVEKTYAHYASTHAQAMHACGHDGHMSVLLGLARVLKDRTLKRSVVFIFQPAEEGPGGAKEIVDAGILEKYQVKNVFGLHLYPNLEEGLIGLVKGPMMAQNGEFELTIKGQSAHGAEPHAGCDVMVGVAQLIQGLHTIVSRNINPSDTAVLTVGTLQAGEASNVIASKAQLSGTIRAFNEEAYQRVKDRFLSIVRGIEQSFELKIETSLVDLYPAVVNDDDLFDMVRATLYEEEIRLIEPMMFSEDFAFYQQAVPGFFFMLGTKNTRDAFTAPLHSDRFDFNPDVLGKGVEVFLRIAKTFGVME